MASKETKEKAVPTYKILQIVSTHENAVMIVDAGIDLVPTIAKFHSWALITDTDGNASVVAMVNGGKALEPFIPENPEWTVFYTTVEEAPYVLAGLLEKRIEALKVLRQQLEGDGVEIKITEEEEPRKPSRWM